MIFHKIKFAFVRVITKSTRVKENISWCVKSYKRKMHEKKNVFLDTTKLYLLFSDRVPIYYVGFGNKMHYNLYSYLSYLCTPYVSLYFFLFWPTHADISVHIR